MESIINQFRIDNGRPLVSNWDMLVSEFCRRHSWAMAYKGLYHAESYYLNDWAEAIAMCGARELGQDVRRYLIYDVLGTSEPHRNILLYSEEMAVGMCNANGVVYLTIRGR